MNFLLILLVLKFWYSTARFIKNARKLGDLSIFKGQEIPEYCKLDKFLANNIDKTTLKASISEETLENLNKCSKYYPLCNDYPGDISATYREDTSGKLSIMFELKIAKKRSNQDCWGYLVEMYDGEETVQYFVSTKEKNFIYRQSFFIRLAFTYQFVVTSLPGDKSLKITTTAPTLCQYAVIDHIWYKINETAACTNAKSLPTYDERYEIAQRICKQYPQNSEEKFSTLKKIVITSVCKIEL